MEVGRRLPGLVLGGKMEVGAVGVLHQQDTVHVVAIDDGVGLALLDLGGGVQDALDDLGRSELAVVGVGHGLDFGTQVNGVGEQAAFALLQVEDAGIASVGAPLVDRDGTLRQVHAGRVG